MLVPRFLAALALVVLACGSSATTPEGEILLPEDRCRAVGLASCDNGGRCIEDRGTPRCACVAGYTGPTCRECAPGAVCGTGPCAVAKCAPHAGCREEKGAAVCSCAAGYASQGETCVWKGVIADPTFQNTPAGAWVVGAGLLKPGAAGGKDPGLLEIGGATCTSGVGARQTVTMPPLELAEPLALEVSGLASCQVDVGDPPVPQDTPCDRPVVMGVGPRAFEPFPALDRTPQTSRQCLGDRSFGKAIEITFSAATCSSVSTAIDRAEIVPAPECPLPGQVFNGDFEGAGGWKADSATGIAEVASGVGNGSTRGGRLKTTASCQGPQLRGSLSVPFALPRPALTFTARGNTGRRLRVFAADALVGVVTGSNVFETATICLPDFLKGQSASLAFAGGGDRRAPCPNTDDYEFVFDDIAVKSDPSCPEEAKIVDGSFERPDADRYWFANVDAGATATFPKTGGADGPGFLVLNHTQCQRSSSVAGTVTIPEAMPGSGGPRLSFRYRATASNNTFYSGPSGLLAPAVTWTETKTCLPPRYAGAPYPVSFGLSSGSNCQASQLAVDAVAVGRDPACPEQ